MKGKWGLLTGAVAAGTMLASVSGAEAGVLSLQLQSGATTVTIADGSGLDANGAVGGITFIGAVGVFTLNVTTGLGLNALPGPYPHLDLASVNVSSGAGSITMMLSETGLSSAGLQSFLTEWGGTNQGTSSLEVYVNTDDGLFSTTGTKVADLDFGAGAFSGEQSGGALTNASYSVTMVWTTTHTDAGVSSGDARFQIPEPMTLSLLGLGLLGLGAATRRRKAA